MGRRHSGSRFVIGLSLAIVMLVAGPAASAFATARIRLVNVRPNGTAVGLKVVVGGPAPPSIGPASYGQVTPYARVPPGSAQIALTGMTGTQPASQTTEHLQDGQSYTVLALAHGSKGFSIKVYRDGHGKPGGARLRVIHAAPELGSPDIDLGQRKIAEHVSYTDATPYLSESPGSYQLAIVKPSGGAPIFTKRISLSAGVATTAIVTGGGGEPERVVLATDDTRTPAGAPETGLGGLARGGGPPWLLAALAALLAGAIGGAVQLSIARRR